MIWLVDVNADSGHWSDIQDAVDLASTGDRVCIPEGTWNFVNDQEDITTVQVPAGVSIAGVATERDGGGHVVEYKTILRLPWEVPGTWSTGRLWFNFTGTYQDGEKSRFTDIKLVGYRTIDPTSTVMSNGIQFDSIKDFHLDHCYLENIAGHGVYTDGLYCRGLVDHVHFVNTAGVVGTYLDDCTVMYGIQMNRATGDYWDADIDNVLGQYTDYSVYIENCVFTLWRHCTAANDGAHYVLRYCTIVDDWGYGSIDSHGGGIWQDPPGVITSVGTRATEIYECSITNATNHVRGSMLRGGAGVAYNNTFGGGTYTRFLFFSNDSAAEPNLSKMWINDWWIWDNTLLNGEDLVVEYDPENQIIEGVNYFLSEKPGWVPYTYPHPLTGENGGDPKMEQEQYDRLKARVSAIGRTRAQWSEEKLTSALLSMIDEILDALAP